MASIRVDLPRERLNLDQAVSRYKPFLDELVAMDIGLDTWYKTAATKAEALARKIENVQEMFSPEGSALVLDAWNGSKSSIHGIVGSASPVINNGFVLRMEGIQSQAELDQVIGMCEELLGATEVEVMKKDFSEIDH